MVVYHTLITVITCTITEILHGLLLHIDVSLVHRYTNARTTACHILGCYHRYMDSRHITVTHACMVSLFLSYGFPFILHVLLFHGTVVMLYDCFLLLIRIFPILDMRAVDMRCVESHIYCSRYIVPVLYCSCFPLYCSCYIVPVSRYIVLCYQQSSGPVFMLPVSCTVVVLVTLYT